MLRIAGFDKYGLLHAARMIKVDEPKVTFVIPEFRDLPPETIADACRAIEGKINADIGRMIERQARAAKALWGMYK